MPELGTYEKFVVDEVCAFVLATEQEKQLEEARKKNASGGDPGRKDPLGGKSPVEWMMSDQFQSK